MHFLSQEIASAVYMSKFLKLHATPGHMMPWGRGGGAQGKIQPPSLAEEHVISNTQSTMLVITRGETHHEKQINHNLTEKIQTNSNYYEMFMVMVLCLPKSVIFKILLHCMANVRSELSNIVMRSPSATEQKSKTLITKGIKGTDCHCQW